MNALRWALVLCALMIVLGPAVYAWFYPPVQPCSITVITLPSGAHIQTVLVPC